jgi:predicted Zn-dependent protease
MNQMSIPSLRAPRALAAALIATLALASCETVQTTQPGTVGVDRKQSMLLSSAQVDKSAALAYQQEMKKAAAKKALNRDAAQVARVRVIALRLIPGTAAFRPDAPKWAWETNVITSNDVNAWCMPGGRMAVYRAHREAQGYRRQAAAVMGHEIAHALREHGRERVSQAYAQALGLTVVGSALGLGQGSMQVAQMVTDITFNLPNSREHEVEADRIGVELAARAGYDPRAAITLWQKMGQAGGGAPPQFLSTHPSPQNRQKDLEDFAARVMPLYEATRKR